MDELAKYRTDFSRNLGAAEKLAAGLSDEQFCWRPAPGVWSVCENLLHLIASGRLYLSAIDGAISHARENGFTAPGPFRYSMFDRWFVWMMEPPVRLKLRAPKNFLPPAVQPGEQVLQDFAALNQDWLRRLEEVRGLDLKRIKIPSPASARIKVSLGTTFALNAAHERRHLWQAEKSIAGAFGPAPRVG